MATEISVHQKELESKLWGMANTLRGTMEAAEFKNYILGMIFYYYLSKRQDVYMQKLLKDDGISFVKAWESEDYKEAVIEETLRDLGYIIEPQYLFTEMVRLVDNSNFDVEYLQKAINSLMESTMGTESEQAFEGLFDDMVLDSSKLGRTVKDRSTVMAKIISTLADITIDADNTKIDILGNAYEYLIGQFAANAGKKAGEFYTPSAPAELLAMLACDGLTDIQDACDPTCGSGSLLLRLQNHANVRRFWGQELTAQTYNLCRMNMILRGVKYQNFHIFNGDTLVSDNFEGKQFRVQVANPPYSAHVQHPEKMPDDARFNMYGKFVPRTKADLAFLQHMIHHMDEDGRIAVLLPHGVLFRGNAEYTIRKYMIEKLNVIDAIIGLPANLFYGTSIPVSIIICKKNRNGNSGDILFIDASKEFKSGKNQNELEPKHIHKIFQTYHDRAEIEKYSHRALMSEIIKNDYNLNIPRYVDSSEDVPEIDLAEVAGKIKVTNAEIEQISSELKKSFDLLGIEFPF